MDIQNTLNAIGNGASRITLMLLHFHIDINNLILKLPRIEKFNIGNEYKISMYNVLRKAIYINKVGNRLEYLNTINEELVLERIFLC